MSLWGIVALVRLNAEADGALEADLLERLGITLEQIPEKLSWRALKNYAKHIGADPTSHLYRALNPEIAAYGCGLKQSLVLADLFDALRTFDVHFCNAHRKEGTPEIQPLERYPRPGEKKSKTRIGEGAIPIADFAAWYYGDEIGFQQHNDRQRIRSDHALDAGHHLEPCEHAHS